MIVAQETIRYHRRAMALDAAPAVRGLQAAMDAIVQTELRRFQFKLRALTSDQQQAIQLLLRGITNKILHPAIRNLKQAGQRGDSETIVSICELFGVVPFRLPTYSGHVGFL